MAFTPKDWRNFPETTTPISAEALEDIESRLAAYTEANSGGQATTADTGETFKIILLSDGTVKAIPASATPPDVPTGLLAVPKLSSVKVTWNAAARATSYIVYRSNVAIKTTSTRAYRDLAITAGQTYQYQVQSVDQYGQRSAKTANFPAFVDPALNVVPTVNVKAWPPTFPTNGRGYIRVNASDLNAQELEVALEVTAGTIAATDDPSVWIYTP